MGSLGFLVTSDAGRRSRPGSPGTCFRQARGTTTRKQITLMMETREIRYSILLRAIRKESVSESGGESKRSVGEKKNIITMALYLFSAEFAAVLMEIKWNNRAPC